MDKSVKDNLQETTDIRAMYDVESMLTRTSQTWFKKLNILELKMHPV